MHQSVDVRRDAFPFFSSGVLQDILDDAGGAFSVQFDSGEVFAQVSHDVLYILCIVFRQFVEVVFEVVAEVVDQCFRQFAEVDDEVERVSYLVYDARTQQSQRSEFLLLFQLLLQLFQLFFQFFYCFHSACC